MELLLNLIWMTVIALLSWAVCVYRFRSSEQNYSWITVAVAIACIAALIFPAISLSDDLHVECTAIESPAKRIHQLIVNLQQTPSVLALSSVLLASTLSALLQIASRATFEEAIAAPLEGFLPPSIGRAPPLLSL